MDSQKPVDTDSHSEKMRRVMGDIPTSLLHIGTFVIMLSVLLGALTVWMLVSY